MYVGWQLFSHTLLLEMEESILIRWITLYALVSVWRRGEIEKHTRALAHLASLSRAWRGNAMGAGARRARE
jgi:hypothetical protein